MKATILEPRREDFVAAMARAVSGVAILATDGPRGRFGITVSSFTSVSADPPLVLACVNRTSVAHAAVLRNGVFCVNLLSTEQRELADVFAGRPLRGRPYDFKDEEWHTGDTGAPRLEEAVATFDCALEQAHDAGSHTIFIGRVRAVTGRTAEPLLYTARSYGRPLRWAERGPAAGAHNRARHSAAA